MMCFMLAAITMKIVLYYHYWTRYLADKAKKASCFEQLNYSVTRSRFDTEKARHFIDLFSSGAIQVLWDYSFKIWGNRSPENTKSSTNSYEKSYNMVI